MKKQISTAVMLGLLAAALSSCTITRNVEGTKIDYRDSSLTNPLEIPPDLDGSSIKPAYKLPDQEVSVNDYLQQQAARDTSKLVAPNKLDGFKLHLNAENNWLEADLPIADVWKLTGSFWNSLGMALVKNDALAGVMETNWAENKAAFGKDPVSQVISKFFKGSLVDSGFRDRFKTIVREEQGKVKIIIQHQAMEEKYVGSRSILNEGNRPSWVTGKKNPELEVELLRRLMVFLYNNSQRN